MFDQVAIIGDGQMATVMAIILAEQRVRVRMWSASPERAAALKSLRENKRYLPGVAIPDRVSFTADPPAVLTGAELAVSAVPCQYLRGAWTKFTGCFPRDLPIVSVTKGIEVDTLHRPSEVLGDVLGAVRTVVLSGP